jgi:hypothetical protein
MFSDLLFGSDDSDCRIILQLGVVGTSAASMLISLTRGIAVGAGLLLAMMAFVTLFSRLRVAAERMDELGGMDARVARRIERHWATTGSAPASAVAELPAGTVPELVAA